MSNFKSACYERERERESKNFFLLITILLFSVFYFLTFSSGVSASTTDGTIDSTYHYAWGENVGWVDFGSTAGNVHINDSALSGSAYGENIGWIDLSTITNTNEGVLAGYAWGENVGWVDFSNVTIGSDGVFSGSAYGENMGWITFGTGDNKVVTDWRPASARSSSRSSSTTSGRTYGCKDPTALNYNYFSASNPALCKYATVATTPLSSPLLNQGGEGNSAPACLITLTLRVGSRGAQVKCLQTILNENLKFSPALLPDGIFGPKTKIAVILFQKANNLVPDGIVGPLTRAIINK